MSHQEKQAIKLWTHHPSTFQLDTVKRIDPTKGQYWHSDDPQLKYQVLLPKLQSHLGTSQFLWCCTVRGIFKRMTEQDDLVEWEIDSHKAVVLRWVSVPVWEDMVYGRSHDWNELFITGGHADKDVVALVEFPLSSGTAKCQGQLPVKYQRRMSSDG